MHSYRHGFHAANHADVLKHAVLIQILDYAARKSTPFQIIDTHAGAGLYDLGHDWSRQSGEADTGVARVLRATVDAAATADTADALDAQNATNATDATHMTHTATVAHVVPTAHVGQPPPLITRYVQALAQCRAQHGAQAYPGSPWLALHALRRGDHLHLFETHPSEIQALRHFAALRRDISARQVTLHATDGFAAPKALLPPTSRRGVVVIDPPYEDKQDYRHVTQALTQGLQRFATGCYVVWHPMVQRREAADMTRRLRRLPGVDWLHATLQVKQTPRDGLGLYGSGVFVINPPWTLRAELERALPWLRDQLAQDGHAQFNLTGCRSHE